MQSMYIKKGGFLIAAFLNIFTVLRPWTRFPVAKMLHKHECDFANYEFKKQFFFFLKTC